MDTIFDHYVCRAKLSHSIYSYSVYDCCHLQSGIIYLNYIWKFSVINICVRDEQCFPNEYYSLHTITHFLFAHIFQSRFRLKDTFIENYVYVCVLEWGSLLILKKIYHPISLSIKLWFLFGNRKYYYLEMHTLCSTTA